MTFDNLNLVPVTGKFTLFGKPASGRVTFTASTILKDPVNKEIHLPAPVALILTDGAFTTALPATTGPGLQPTGWMYTVEEAIIGAAPRTYDIEVPHDGGPVDLVTKAPSISVETISPYALVASVDAVTADVDVLRRFTPTLLEHGAVGDGVADDTAALQSWADALGGVGAPALGTVYLGPGTFRLTDTVVISKRSGRIQGAGVGNPTTYGPSPGAGTTFKWDGPAGLPMFRVSDCTYLEFHDLLVLGSDSAPPSEGIYFEEPPDGGTIGGNAHCLVRGCRFGNWTWTSPDLNGGKMDYGLRWGGRNTNNDQFSVENCQFVDCTTAGVAIDNTQSVWGQLSNAYFLRCGVGFVSAAQVFATNLTFNRCSVDIEVLSTAEMFVFGCFSEHSALNFRLLGPGRLRVYGGRILLQEEMVGPNFAEHHEMGTSAALALVGVTIVTQTTTKKLYARGSVSSSSGSLTVTDCLGLDSLGRFDVQAGSGFGMWVSIESRGLYRRTFLNNNEVLAAAPVIADSDGTSADSARAVNALLALLRDSGRVA